MPDDDQLAPDSETLTSNILHCLQMLEEEADSLGLFRTQVALRKAIRACQTERAAPAVPARRRGIVLH